MTISPVVGCSALSVEEFNQTNKKEERKVVHIPQNRDTTYQIFVIVFLTSVRLSIPVDNTKNVRDTIKTVPV